MLKKQNKFILWDDFLKPLDRLEFKKARRKYLQCLVFDSLPILSKNVYDLVEIVKRIPHSIGPYRDISFFESINRIASDLVVIAAGDYLFKKGNVDAIEFRLSTRHGYDLIISNSDGTKSCGEAFNTSPGHGGNKVRATVESLSSKEKKSKDGLLKDYKTKYIFINSSMKPKTNTENIYRKLENNSIKDVEIIFVETQNLQKPIKV